MTFPRARLARRTSARRPCGELGRDCSSYTTGARMIYDRRSPLMRERLRGQRSDIEFYQPILARPASAALFPAVSIGVLAGARIVRCDAGYLRGASTSLRKLACGTHPVRRPRASGDHENFSSLPSEDTAARWYDIRQFTQPGTRPSTPEARSSTSVVVGGSSQLEKVFELQAANSFAEFPDKLSLRVVLII